jgi:isoleucyl-tRNA synthetase
MFNDMCSFNPDYVLDDKLNADWEQMLKLRNDVNKALELARAEKIIGKPLDAELTLYVSDRAMYDFLQLYDLKTIFIVSKVELEENADAQGYKGDFEGVSVRVKASEAPKCVRCWTHDEKTDEDGLCPRCKAVIAKI